MSEMRNTSSSLVFCSSDFSFTGFSTSASCGAGGKRLLRCSLASFLPVCLDSATISSSVARMRSPSSSGMETPHDLPSAAHFRPRLLRNEKNDSRKDELRHDNQQ